MRAAQAIAVLALAMSTLSAGRLWGGEAPAGTDRDAFLRAYPKAKSLAWEPRPGEGCEVLHVTEPGEGYPPKCILAAFDRTGRKLYERTAVDTSANPAWCARLGPPRILRLSARVLSFRSESTVDKTTVLRHVLVGLHEGRAVELDVTHWRHSSYPIDYDNRTWLEDVDGDGAPELCQFVRNRFRCHQWDAEKVQWQRLRDHERRRVGTRHPPLRWDVTATPDKGERRIRLTLELRSLAECPLELSHSLPELFGSSLRPADARFASPLLLGVSQKRLRSGERLWWRVTPDPPTARSATLPLLGRRTLTFSVELPADVDRSKKITVSLLGRARWRLFEANFDKVLVNTLDGFAPGRRPAQEDIDAGLKESVKHGYADLSRASTAFRKWLIHQALHNNVFRNYFNRLGMDTAEETGHLALAALRENPALRPKLGKQLLLLALRLRAPSEYGAVLREAGGPASDIGPTLVNLLRAPNFRQSSVRYCGGNTYLDMTTLATLLSRWPDADVAAQAKAVLEQAKKKALREAGERGVESPRPRAADR